MSSERTEHRATQHALKEVYEYISPGTNEGISFGLLAYTIVKAAAGRGREVHPLIYVFAVLFLGRYIFLR